MEQGIQVEKTGHTGHKLGGVCAVLVGALYLLLILYVVATSAAARHDAGEFFRGYIGDPTVSIVNWTNLVLTAVLSLAAVAPAASDIVRSVSREWARASTILAIVGWTLMAASFLTLLGRVPDLAQNYAAADRATQMALVAVGLPELDPDGWLVFGGPGIWFVVVNALALRGKKWPKVLACIGVLVGLDLLLTIPAALWQIEPLNLIAAGSGAVVAPIWYTWMGIRLLRAPS